MLQVEPQVDQPHPQHSQTEGERELLDLATIELAAKKIIPELPTKSDERLSVEIIEKILPILKEAFSGVKKYTIFASTALYLHARDLPQAEESLKLTPGDLDVMFHDELALSHFIEKLSNLSQKNAAIDKVEFDDYHKLKPGDDTKASRGVINFRFNDKEYQFPFEIFVNEIGTDRILPPDVYNKSVPINGLTVLKTAGLRRQYIKNYNFEKQLYRRVDDIVRNFTEDPGMLKLMQKIFTERASAGAWPENSELDYILKHYNITADELALVYRLNEALRNAMVDNDMARIEELEGQLSSILAKKKSKVRKRARNIEALRALKAINVVTPEYIK